MIRVRFFGKFSDLVEDPDGLAVSAGGIGTVADVVAAIQALDPALYRAITAPQVSVAVNQSLTNLQAPVKDGDEVAFLPPVTGG